VTVERLYGWDAAAQKLEQVWITAADRKQTSSATPALTMEEVTR